MNGQLAAHHAYGYSNFYVTLDDFLKYGEKNEIRVIANNIAPNSRWYSGSGIYRDVKLLTGNAIFFPADSTQIKTNYVNHGTANLEIKTEIQNRSNRKKTVYLHIEIYDEGEICAQDKVKVTIFGNSREKIYQMLTVQNPKVWNCETPHLYQYKIWATENGQLMDEEEEKFGIRTLMLDTENGLQLNGKSLKLRGACIHHDNGILGAATFEDAEKRRVSQLKQAGFNCIRSAHHPMSKAMLRACDELGMFVMDELSDVWTYHKNIDDIAFEFTDIWEEEIQRMVEKDYNHPSVILYSAGNEIPEIGLDSGAHIKRKICNRFHELDDTRYTTDAMNGSMAISYGCGMEHIIKDLLETKTESSDDSGANALNALNAYMSMTASDKFATHPAVTEALEESTMASDIIGLNYLTGRHVLEKELYPNKTLIGAETYPADIVRLWGLVKRYPHILGDFTWAGYDYLGEAGCGIFHYDGSMNFSNKFPERAAYIGDIDLIGYRRPISYFREIVYGIRKEPYIAVMRMNRNGQTSSKTAWMFKDNVACWTWNGYEGQEASVDVYSNAEEVELFLNGRSLGREKTGEENDFTATYQVEYQPGVLKAVSYENGQETGSFELESAVGESRLMVNADRTEMQANGEDLAFVTIKLEDSLGRENLSDQKTISVEVEGTGTLQAFGNADPSSLGSYDDHMWKTYDGYALAVIRAGEKDGIVKVKISAEGCPTEYLNLSVKGEEYEEN